MASSLVDCISGRQCILTSTSVSMSPFVSCSLHIFCSYAALDFISLDASFSHSLFRFAYFGPFDPPPPRRTFFFAP